MAKILLVDDSAMDRRLFAGILEHESDFTVESCNDGEAALATMAVDAPDIVLTDMQMPNMDGLELVTRVRELYPEIPVILITGRGSESLATKALRAGAAGYVPKSHSSDLLTETVRHVLDRSKTQQEDARIKAATKQILYELELHNDETLIPGLLQLCRQRLQDCGHRDEVTLRQVDVALEQAILNAIYHGNLDFKQYAGVDFDPVSKQREARLQSVKPPYSDRRVHFTMQITPGEARFVVRDEGDGFDVKEVSSLGLSHSLRGEFGHGLFLMWAFMDKVVFGKTGNSVTMIRRFGSAPSVSETAAPATATATATATAEPAEVMPEVLCTLMPRDGGRAFDLTKVRITVGRDQSCDMVINSAAVSHHHCLLFLHEGWWFIRDLNSKNGVKVNGKQYSQHLLPPAAALSIGPHEFLVQYQPHKLGAPGITPPVDPF